MNYRRPVVEVGTDFWPQAVQAGAGVDWRPRAGYRRDRFRNPAGLDIPALAVCIDAERLLDTFLALIEPLGSVVNVALESSHGGGPPVARERDRIDSAVLASLVWEHEGLLLNDGCTGVAVTAPGWPVEVQLDEHKCLFVYAYRLRPFRDILRAAGLRRRREMTMIFEVPHVHRTSREYGQEFRSLCAAADAELPRPNYVG